MHELSIAEAVVDVAISEARRAGARRVFRVELLLGALAGVVEDALRFCFPMACEGTVVEGAELQILPVEGQGWCRACGRTFTMCELLEPCPGCAGFASEIRAGQELSVTSIDVE